MVQCKFFQITHFEEILRICIGDHLLTAAKMCQNTNTMH